MSSIAVSRDRCVEQAGQPLAGDGDLAGEVEHAIELVDLDAQRLRAPAAA